MKKLIVILAVFAAGCGSAAAETEAKQSAAVMPESSSTVPASSEPAVLFLNLSSDDLSDGVWNSVIASNGSGQNLSPELSFDAVEGAEEYAVVMIDPDGNNWLHWIASGIKRTHLSQGENPGSYQGPYPPSGTHTYEVTVYALKAAPDALPGTFDAAGNSPEDLLAGMDTAGGLRGNVIVSETISGTYTAGN
ncbi:MULTISPECIES: YbhB/YbcL family Raf kinase inhibitor-like protein [Erysipelotrichaceae]|uniref:YbhB/YbcL family Raf kinase inhibitor-like protein n=1 Tax=Erysipelotrichaceae TaxID=128827 RepID=UPI000CF8B0BF|nr:MULTISPECIES: YbhB/YbcL family Raf kinase inhibitor-like protein [Erysipelotrichaceae]MDD5881926.1 YbhB/YbcL family Raf kinase inhibitor-like protein [Stecheria intestinalis]MDD6366954.1 YbhB/YbcL family Raf kinase inhibitor-like protein [Stecheria intestinalis]MDD7681215.1 YbhB/YbcL family Raf kinase inhibitor-like protein [Stecheria intestinalis]MDY4682635.1 YbhB/YbcL family Raf kinase inhibitor-like protein [Lachnospiraceae bacterium]